MTVISVGIGAIFSRVPDALKSSLPIGEIAGVGLLVVFGLRSLKVRRWRGTRVTQEGRQLFVCELCGATKG